MSPLRRRMIEDLPIRDMAAHFQRQITDKLGLIGSVIASGVRSVIWFIGRALCRKPSRRPDLSLFASG